MKKFALILLIAFSMINTSMHAVEDLIEKHSLHINSNECTAHSHIHDHEHMHTHNNSSHTHSHSHGENHASSFYFYDNTNNHSFTLVSLYEHFQFTKAQLPKPILEGLFRPPIS